MNKLDEELKFIQKDTIEYQQIQSEIYKKDKAKEAKVKKEEEEWLRSQLNLPTEYKVDLDARTINIPINIYSDKVYWDLMKYEDITQSMDNIETLVSIFTNVYENIKTVISVGGFTLCCTSVLYFILVVIKNIIPVPFEPSLCYSAATLGLFGLLIGSILPDNENGKVYRLIKSVVIKNKMKRIDMIKERNREESLWRWM